MIWQICKVLLRISVGLVLCICVLACKETRRSDSPVSRDEALRDVGIKLPLPRTALKVHYYLSGGTQNWNLYLSFEAPLEDIEEQISKELSFYYGRERNLMTGRVEEYTRKPISPENLTSKIINSAPKWWRPSQIKEGYFVGSSDPHSGPRFWVDTSTSQVFFFEHF